MRSLFILIIAVIQLAACGQVTVKKPAPPTPEVLNSKFVSLIPDTSRMMMIGNVVIQYGDLVAEADSALLEKPKSTITVFGIRKGSFKGDPIDTQRFKAGFRYTKGNERILPF